MILDIYIIVGGVCSLSTKNSANHSVREFFLECHSYQVISNQEQSVRLSRFLVMLSQQIQDFRRSMPDSFPLSRRWGLRQNNSAAVAGEGRESSWPDSFSL